MSTTTIEDRVFLLLKEKMNEPNLVSAELGEKSDLAVVLAAKYLRDAFKEGIGGHGFWERIAVATGISSKRWRKVFADEQRITSDMIEALSKRWPEHAFWLVTGITDSKNGHIAPKSALTFPERCYEQCLKATEYFDLSVELNEQLYKESGVDLSDRKQRIYAAERTMPLNSWIGSELLDVAYKIAETDEYRRLLAIETEREIERERRLSLHDGWNPSVHSEQQKNRTKTKAGFGEDPRGAHQGKWDMFYLPINKDKNDNKKT